MVPTFTSFGISPAVAGLFREMYEGVARGLVAAESAQVRGATPIGEVLAPLVKR